MYLAIDNLNQNKNSILFHHKFAKGWLVSKVLILLEHSNECGSVGLKMTRKVNDFGLKVH